MPRVLVIDGDSVARAFVRAWLQREGHEVIEAHTGLEGASVLRTNVIDLALVAVPIHGMEELIELRTQHPQAKFIVVGGEGWLGAGEFGPLVQRLGAQRTLTRPCGREEFLAAVRAVLAANG